jgi:hypothetical protein
MSAPPPPLAVVVVRDVAPQLDLDGEESTIVATDDPIDFVLSSPCA